MKHLIFAVAFIAASIVLAQQKVDLKDQKDKVSYSIGLDIGLTFKKQNLQLNPDALVAGAKDGLAGNKPAISEEEIKTTMQAFSEDMRQKQEGEAKAQGAKNVAEGEKFLAENKTKEGIKTTPSGLQYKVIKEGTGPQPKATDTVVTNYRGTLLNGTEFDSSYKRGEPAEFPVNRVIPGWTEALQMMKVGSKYQLFIPAKLAY
ncbi:MAG: FKBP-type peptidyl-prolyl cis-trans isomerase, partial [Verrucomicrobiaceae bacterium]|nr:FKBP-type peptidyl-prolyl cis-trans isomerase [Verrucomicrobiaceae bacterium]